MNPKFKQRTYEVCLAHYEASKIPSTHKEIFFCRKAKTILETEFLNSLLLWEQSINDMISQLGHDLVERIIFLKPDLDSSQSSPYECTDFIILTDYFISIRDIRQLDTSIIGRVSMLYTDFQKVVEHNFKKKKTVPLKDPLAEELRQKGYIILDNVEIHFWQYHTNHSISTRETWNKIKSFTELNKYTDGKNGTVVFSGDMQISRSEISEFAIKLGFYVRSNVTKKTDYVVIGSSNVSPDKIASLININESESKQIKIMSENDFLQMVLETLS